MVYAGKILPRRGLRFGCIGCIAFMAYCLFLVRRAGFNYIWRLAATATSSYLERDPGDRFRLISGKWQIYLFRPSQKFDFHASAWYRCNKNS